MLLSIVAPVYNEENVIADVVNRWEEVINKNAIDAEIILTDDGSTDGTPKILEKLQNKFTNLKVETSDKNNGYGKALATAVKRSEGKYILTIDSDGQFELANYLVLYNKLVNEKLDIITGYRGKKKDSFLKIMADRILNFIIRILFGVHLRDTNCALKLWDGELLRKINIEAKGYPAPTELLIKALTLGAKIGEIGVSHYSRQGGESKLRPFKTGIQMLAFLSYLRYKLFLYNWNILNNI